MRPRTRSQGEPTIDQAKLAEALGLPATAPPKKLLAALQALIAKMAKEHGFGPTARRIDPAKYAATKASMTQGRA